MDPDRERELAAAEHDAWLDAEAADDERRRGRRSAPLLVLLFAGAVLAFSAAAGWGLALLVARVASVPPPAVTVSPPPAFTPTPSAAVSPSPSAASPSAAPSPTATAQPSQAIHIVQPGEYLSQIAAQYGVSTEAIVDANGIENPDLIQAGQRLIIPPAP